MIVDLLINYLDSQGQQVSEMLLDEVSKMTRNAFARQFGARLPDKPTLRLSSIGKCPRSLAYGLLGYPKAGKEIDARAKMVFLQGDLVEIAIVALMKQAGLNVTSAQETIYFDGVEGHPDGIYTNCIKQYLLEIKSMSSYSFDNFQKGIVDDSYIYQINAYLEALGLDECVMIGQNKDSGVLHEHIVKKNPQIIADIKSRIEIIKAATSENLPVRPFAADSKGFLPWQCRYCAYYQTCWPNSQLVLDKNKYRLKI